MDKLEEYMNDTIAKSLLEWIAKNNFMESQFLTPQPSSNVDTTGLIDKIAELRGISKEENGNEFNNIADNLEKD